MDQQQPNAIEILESKVESLEAMVMTLYSNDGDGGQTKPQADAVTKEIKRKYDVKVSSLAQARAKARNAKKPVI